MIFSLSATADPTKRTPRPDPLDPKASVPAVAYASSLKLDPRAAADGPISWREANDTVARIGGWRVYAREANQPADPQAPEPRPTPAVTGATAATAATTAPVPTATPHAHGGHKKP